MSEQVPCDICRKPYERDTEERLHTLNTRAVWVCYGCLTRAIALSYLPRWLDKIVF